MTEPDVRARILIVEDEEFIASMMNFIVEKDGYFCDMVTDPTQAIDIYEQYLHDIVLLDLNMPGLSGFDLIKEFASRGDAKVIIVSASSGDMIKARCIMEGACDFLEKPFRSADLRERIAFHLREGAPVQS